jgi:ABC-type branched-subunit amino acid transport system substrate-binding protein
MSRRGRNVAGAVVAALLAASLSTTAAVASSPQGATSSSTTSPSAGGTIVVAGLGFLDQFNAASVGARARFQRANADHEVEGYTFDYREFADDKNDPATALAQAQRLVTTGGVFAVVPDVSTATPAEYLTRQHVPWFGPGYDESYCPRAGKRGWGFGVYGCLLPVDQRAASAPNWELLATELRSQGNARPTVALISDDSASGRANLQKQASLAHGVGFDVVYAEASVPAPPAAVTDETPYAKALLTADRGGQPDIVFSSVGASTSMQLLAAVRSSGFTGSFFTPIYSPVLFQALAGSYIYVQFAGFESNAAGVQQMLADVHAVKPDATNSLTLAAGYFSADMFVKAVEAARRSAKRDAPLTREAVQRAAATMTYQIKGTVGPTEYPASYRVGVKACATLEHDADGTGVTVVQPYRCTTKTYPILARYAR